LCHFEWSTGAAEYTCMHCGDMFYHKSYRQPNLAYGAYFACNIINMIIHATFTPPWSLHGLESETNQFSTETVTRVLARLETAHDDESGKLENRAESVNKRVLKVGNPCRSQSIETLYVHDTLLHSSTHFKALSCHIGVASSCRLPCSFAMQLRAVRVDV